MDLDLEADLGIDTVKQAEVFASIREAYGIERDDTIKLRDYPTLNHVIGFVKDRAGAPPAAAPAPEPEVAAAPEPAPVAEPAVAAAPDPAPVAEPTAAPADADIEAKVLEIVAEQTGYPTDLLDKDLDLEADLGIDTVKQAEVFASIREAYGIERNDTLKLRDYPTLNDVIGFVKDNTGTAAATAAESGQAPATEAPAPIPHPIAEAPGFPRRVPVPVLRPPLDDCVPTTVTLEPSKTRVVVMPDAGGVTKALATRLTKRGAEVLTIDGVPSVEGLEDQLARWTEEGPITGVYWLPALDPEGPPSRLDAQARTDALHKRVKLLAATMRALPDSAFLVSATRLGGRHGYDADGAANVFGGAVTGFTKALGREREDMLIKAVDFGEARDLEVADVLIEETLADPGAVEIGYADGLRWTVAIQEQPAIHEATRDLDRDSVFLVTGAAGSIVSAIIADLAKASRGTFHLFDLVPEPDRNDPDLVKFVSDRDGLKRDLAERIKARGERPTPKLIERELAKLERAKAALDAIDAIEWGGGSAHWHQVDLTDPDQVAQAVASANAQTKPVSVVVHAAGLEISHFLPDKPQQEYDLVFDVKAHGWLNLLAALNTSQPDSPPQAAIVFSSIAGRFGNGGQTDYSAANDLLCKSVSNFRHTKSPTRGTAIDWTAWASIGMAARGSIPKMMEMAGIEMLPPEVGIPVVRRELTVANTATEIVEAGALGIMAEERHETGGLDVERATANLADHAGPMTGRVVTFSSDGTITIVTELDPTRQAFLNDHRIDGTPVLPGVMGMEGFAEVARALLPEFHVVELTNVDLLAPFKFYRDQPREVILRACLTDGGNQTITADCELIGRRDLRDHSEQETRHFVGRAKLARQAPSAPMASENPAAPDVEKDIVGKDAVYGIYFHGPAYQVLDRAWRDNGHVVGTFASELPANHEPASQPMELAPRLIELCFQTAGVWEIGVAGRMALPTHVDRVVRFASPGKQGPLWAVVSPREDGKGVDAEIVDEAGRVRVRLEGYRTVELPGELEATALDPIRVAMHTADLG